MQCNYSVKKATGSNFLLAGCGSGCNELLKKIDLEIGLHLTLKKNLIQTCCEDSLFVSLVKQTCTHLDELQFMIILNLQSRFMEHVIVNLIYFIETS